MYTFRGSKTNTKTNTNTHSEDQIQIQTQIDKTRDIFRDFRKGIYLNSVFICENQNI